MTVKKNIYPSCIFFGRWPKRNWIVDETADSVKGDIFDIYSFPMLPNSIGNIAALILSPYYSFKIPNKEIYVVGAPSTILALKIKRKILRKKFKIIHFVKNDFYNRKNHKGIKRKFLDFLANEIDGAIVPGKMIEKEIREKFNFPIEISYHFTKNKDAFKLKINKKSRDIITIGIQPNLRKGTDIFINIAQEMKSIKFYLLGNPKILSESLKEKIKKSKNVITPGFIAYSEMLKYIEKSKFFLLPGRYDAGPIAITDAMASGLIPITSNKMGGSDLVKELRKDLVINSLDYKLYLKKIKELSNLSDSELNKLSIQSRKIASRYDLVNGKRDFKEKLLKLVEKIERH